MAGMRDGFSASGRDLAQPADARQRGFQRTSMGNSPISWHPSPEDQKGLMGAAPPSPRDRCAGAGSERASLPIF
jgi:hypothetical protein